MNKQPKSSLSSASIREITRELKISCIDDVIDMDFPDIGEDKEYLAWREKVRALKLILGSHSEVEAYIDR